MLDETKHIYGQIGENLSHVKDPCYLEKLVVVCCLFETGSCSIVQAGLEMVDSGDLCSTLSEVLGPQVQATVPRWKDCVEQCYM